MPPEADLATLDGLTSAVARSDPRESEQNIGPFDGTFCPKCGDVRRMQLRSFFWQDRWADGSLRGTSSGEMWTPPASKNPKPALFVAVCLQCSGGLTLVVYRSPTGMALVALPETYGGLATPSTPPGVAYYLDQAQRCLATGALSAAVPMYRAALEHLLHEQGYKNGMLGQRIKTLEDDGNPPPWRDRLHPDYLTVINKLGNAAIHANDGDIQQQRVFEAELLGEVRALFIELLDEVYEQPHRKQTRLDLLRQTANSFKH